MRKRRRQSWLPWQGARTLWQQLLLAPTAEAMLVLDAQQRLLGANRSFARLLGYRHPVRHRRHLQRLLDDTRDRDTGRYPWTGGGRHQWFRAQLRGRDGTPIVVELRGVPAVLDGSPVRVYACRPRPSGPGAPLAERLVVSPVGILVMCEGRIVLSNPAGAQLLGAMSPETLIGLPLSAIVVPDLLPVVSERIAQLLAGTAGLYPAFERYQRMDGTQVPVRVVAMPVQYRDTPAAQLMALAVPAASPVEPDTSWVHTRRTILGELDLILSAATSADQLIADLARLLVTHCADACIIDQIDPAGTLQHVAAADRAGGLGLGAARLPQRAAYGAEHAVPRVIATGSAVTLTAPSPQELAPALPPAVLGALAPMALLVVPLRMFAATLGAVTLLGVAGGHRFPADDQLLVTEIVERSIQALTRRRLERGLQAALQHQAERIALLDTLVASAPVGLAVVTPELRYLLVNAALAEMNGLPVAAHADRTIGELLPDLVPALLPIYEDVLRTGRPILDREVRGVTQAQPGVERYWLANYYPVRLGKGQISGVAVVVIEITERRRAELAIQQSATQLHALSARLVEVQEAERRHLARELHDEIGQLLTGLNLLLEVGPQVAGERLSERLRDAQAVVRDVTARVRTLSLTLRPPMLDDLGLLATLTWHLERYTEQTQIQVHFRQSGLDRLFDPAVAIAAYRIVQEGLTNVARHAHVREVSVVVWATSALLGIEIEDHGPGFDPEAVRAAAASIGLAGMEERAVMLGGQVTVDSIPGAGTRVVAVLPLDPAAGGALPA